MRFGKCSCRMSLVSINQLSKSYGAGSIVLSELSLEIKSGEFLVLVGPSGCGKSTLLRMVAGLEGITSGNISFDGKVVNDLSPKDRGVAMVFQNYALYPHLTVQENIGFALKISKVPESQIQKKVQEVASLLDLTQHLFKKPGQLSGGQKQRVAIGRAIVREPKVLLFDEPLSNLDAQLRVRMRSEIAALHRRLGCTVIYVTHDQIEAMTLGHRLAVMNRGKIEQLGTPLEVYQNPKSRFVAGFIGSPSMNFIFKENRWIGFRPESLILGEGELPLGKGKVSFVENLGASGHVHFDLEGQKLIGNFNSEIPKVDSLIPLSVSEKHLFYFTEQGERV